MSLFIFTTQFYKSRSITTHYAWALFFLLSSMNLTHADSLRLYSTLPLDSLHLHLHHKKRHPISIHHVRRAERMMAFRADFRRENEPLKKLKENKFWWLHLLQRWDPSWSVKSHLRQQDGRTLSDYNIQNEFCGSMQILLLARWSCCEESSDTTNNVKGEDSRQGLYPNQQFARWQATWGRSYVLY